MLSCLCGKSLSSHGVSSPGVWSRSESGSGHDLGETGVSSEVLKVPCPRAKPGKPGWKPGILTSSPPGNSGWNRATLALVPLENKTFQGYRAVKTGTKLMMRGTAQSSLHGRTCREAVYLFKTEARQKHTPREECGRPPEWEGEEDTYIIIYLYHYHTSLISGSSSWPLFSLANHPASFPTSDLVQGPLRQASASFSQDGFHGRGRWEIHSAYYGRAVPLFFDPRGTFPHMCSQGSLLDPKNDRSGHLISLLQQSSAPAMNFFLEGSRENNFDSDSKQIFIECLICKSFTSLWSSPYINMCGWGRYYCYHYSDENAELREMELFKITLLICSKRWLEHQSKWLPNLLLVYYARL